MNNNSKLIELLLCIPIGIYTTLLLLEVCISTMQPLVKQLENINKTNLEYVNIIEKEI